LSPYGKGLAGTPTHFAVINEHVFTQKLFKLIKICLNEFNL